MPVRLLSMLMFGVVMIATVGATIGTRSEVNKQEQSLAEERARQIRSQITLLINQIQNSIGPLAGVIAGTKADPQAFAAQAQTIAAIRDNGAVMLIKSDGTNQLVTLTTNQRHPVGAVLDSQATQTIRNLEKLEQGQAPILSTGPIVDIDGSRFVGVAFHSPAFPSDTNLYAEITVNSFAALIARDVDPQSAMNLHVYASATPQASQLVYTTQHSNNRFGKTFTVAVPMGADNWSFTLQAEHPVAGRATHALPWIVLCIGTMLAISLGVIVEILLRRKDDALSRLNDKTRQLSKTLDAADKRARQDHLFQKTAREVTKAPNLTAAFAIYSDTASKLLEFDRSSLALVTDESVQVVAASGAMVTSLPVGTILDPLDEQITRVLTTRRSEIINIHNEAASTPNFQTRLAVPLVVGGKLRSLITFDATTPNAFDKSDVETAERLAREAAAPLYLLLVIDREREAGQRLRELDVLKNEFIGMVAHDLRSPMTVISGFADFLDSHLDTLDDNETRLYLKRISENSKRLAAFSEDVLQAARLESGELKVSSKCFDLGSLVRTTAEGFSLTNDSYIIKVNLAPGLPQVRADEGQQWQIINNLISNALKFSSTIVDIDLRSDENFVYVTVADNGAGIDAATASHLFDKFYRAENHQAHVQSTGTGLGLYICKSLIEAHGGSISVDTKRKVGAAFTYSVPRADVEVVSLRDNAPDSRGATSKLGRHGQ